MAVGEGATAAQRPVPASRGDAPVTLLSAVADPRTDLPTPPEPCLLILAFLWVVMSIVALPVLTAPSAPDKTVATTANINPNLAVWWELTVLPRIGRGLAREIIRHRQSAAQSPAGAAAAPVFRAASDLAQVRGIGPKTVQRIDPYLHFDLLHERPD